MVSLRYVTEVNASVSKCHRVALIDKFANELDRLARLDLLVDIAATIDPRGRSVSEVRYPGWIRSNAAFREQSERIGSTLPLPGLRRRGSRP
jgi:hypothetical protein